MKDIFQDDYKRKVKYVIDNNNDKVYLKGFSNFINKSNSTIYTYLLYVLNFMEYIQKDIKDLELDDYTEYLSTIEDKSISYRISVYSALKKFSTYLNASNKNKLDPMKYVDRPQFCESIETKTKRENGYLEIKEIKKLLKAIDEGVGSNRAISRQKEWTLRDKAIICILLNTGMRCSALYRLNIDNIDFDNNLIRVLDKGNKYKEYNISGDLLLIIKHWISARSIILNGKKEEALFISNQKTRIKQQTISNIVSKYSSVIDGKNITPHKLRATYGTQLYAKTGNLYMVQECMGHSNPKTTELYIRGQKNEVSKTASDIMSKLIF